MQLTAPPLRVSHLLNILGQISWGYPLKQNKNKKKKKKNEVYFINAVKESMGRKMLQPDRYSAKYSLCKNVSN